MDLINVVTVFMTAKRADGLAASTLRDYERALARLTDYFNTVGDLDRDTVRAYAVRIRSNGWAEGTCNLHLRYIRAFLRWLWCDGYTSENLALAIKAPRPTVRWEELLTTEELQALLDACTGTWRARDRAIILFLVDTGMRRGEFIGLTRAQVHFDNEGAWLLFDAPKNGNRRYAVLGVTAARALRAYLDARDDSDPALWVGENGPLGYHGVYRMLRRRAVDAGIEPSKVHPHAFRKVFATWWIKNGGDEQRLMALGGWSGPEMLRIYVRLGNLDALRAGHADYSPVDNLE